MLGVTKESQLKSKSDLNMPLSFIAFQHYSCNINEEQMIFGIFSLSVSVHEVFTEVIF